MNQQPEQWEHEFWGKYAHKTRSPELKEDLWLSFPRDVVAFIRKTREEAKLESYDRGYGDGRDSVFLSDACAEATKEARHESLKGMEKEVEMFFSKMRGENYQEALARGMASHALTGAVDDLLADLSKKLVDELNKKYENAS